ncbi:hypothetical protein RchiOBHm_Chr6g0311691 [Rosa chinensis]|uniref:Transmembrane protein n=1 Tax=Rosa chinensis TaxID=74649 RepID=A0A2P6Q1H3_ROSCH|nr:hypothetical protein RchiOBHm_Chr6g0311691 [Rosa chinensis]
MVPLSSFLLVCYPPYLSFHHSPPFLHSSQFLSLLLFLHLFSIFFISSLSLVHHPSLYMFLSTTDSTDVSSSSITITTFALRSVTLSGFVPQFSPEQFTLVVPAYTTSPWFFVFFSVLVYFGLPSDSRRDELGASRCWILVLSACSFGRIGWLCYLLLRGCVPLVAVSTDMEASGLELVLGVGLVNFLLFLLCFSALSWASVVIFLFL